MEAVAKLPLSLAERLEYDHTLRLPASYMHAVANPVLLVEVLSKTTFDFDLRVKSPLYRQIPSLRQLLLVDSEQLAITSLTRRGDTDAWILRDHYDLADEVDILDQGKISLKDIYRKVKF